MHRLLAEIGKLQRANVLIVVAGMEGALPSVVAVWFPPVIAAPCPTSIGTARALAACALWHVEQMGSGVRVK